MNQAAITILAAIMVVGGGAVSAVASGPAPAALDEAAPSARQHLVQPGECLSLIASTYGVSLQELARLNQIRDVNLIYAGQILTLPVPAAGVREPTRAGRTRHVAPALPVDGPAGTPSPAAAAMTLYDARPPVAATATMTDLGSLPPEVSPGTGRLLVAWPEVTESTVALTFNGELDAALLPATLTALDRYDWRATFFVPARQVAAAPDLVAQLRRRGHEVGIYGYSGLDLATMPATRVMAELRAAVAVLASAGAQPRFVRPPGGAAGGWLQKAAGELGLDVVLWSSIGLRDKPGTRPEQLAAQAEASLFPGAVLMLRADRPSTVYALPAVLSRIHAAGYRSVSLSDWVSEVDVAHTSLEVR